MQSTALISRSCKRLSQWLFSSPNGHLISASVFNCMACFKHSLTRNKVIKVKKSRQIFKASVRAVKLTCKKYAGNLALQLLPPDLVLQNILSNRNFQRLGLKLFCLNQVIFGNLTRVVLVSSVVPNRKILQKIVQVPNYVAYVVYIEKKNKYIYIIIYINF